MVVVVVVVVAAAVVMVVAVVVLVVCLFRLGVHHSMRSLEFRAAVFSARSL